MNTQIKRIKKEMDITQLRYFLTAAETLNYTRAASQLYISRQALRQAITSLENELSVSLFVNRKNKLSLTEEGEYLKVSGASLMRTYEEMIDGLQNIKKEKSAFTIAFSHSLFPFIAPEWDTYARQFQKQYPSVRLEIIHQSNDEIIQALRQDKLTCGFLIQMPYERPGFIMEPFVSYNVRVSCQKNHPILQKKSCELKDLAQYPSIGMGSLDETMHPLCQDCLEKGIQLQYEAISESLDAFYRIEHSNAIGFDIYKSDLPEYTRSPGILLPDYKWEIGLLYRENSPRLHDIRLLSRFMRAAHEQNIK